MLTADDLVRLLAVDDLSARRETAARIAGPDTTYLESGEILARAAGAERHGGRSRMPPLVRVVGALGRSALRIAEDAAFQVRELGRLEPQQRRQLAQRVRKVAAALRALADRLGP